MPTEAQVPKLNETAQLGNLAAEPRGPPSGYTGDPKGGPNFCQPFSSEPDAIAILTWAGPLLLAGIAKKVNSRVLPLCASYLTGGSAPKNLSAEFGKDFTASPTTADTTKFLVGESRKDVEANQAALLGGRPTPRSTSRPVCPGPWPGSMTRRSRFHPK